MSTAYHYCMLSILNVHEKRGSRWLRWRKRGCCGIFLELRKEPVASKAAPANRWFARLWPIIGRYIHRAGDRYSELLALRHC